jgi:5-methylthioadenosine/S-adenosylhomocysteine deaminase
MSLVVRDGLVVTQNHMREVFRGDVLVEGGKIAALGQSLKGDEVLDARGCAVVPGLINCHGHASMTVMRAVADDLNLEQFLEKTFAVDAKRRPLASAGTWAGSCWTTTRRRRGARR